MGNGSAERWMPCVHSGKGHCTLFCGVLAGCSWHMLKRAVWEQGIVLLARCNTFATSRLAGMLGIHASFRHAVYEGTRSPMPGYEVPNVHCLLAHDGAAALYEGPKLSLAG